MAPLERQREIESRVDEIVLPPDEIMQHLPFKNAGAGNTRQVLYISGASGSGKSYYTARYLSAFHRLFPKHKIYIVSSVEKDEQLDSIPGVKRIRLDEKFVNTPFTIEDFRDCMVVYDDTEMISNKVIMAKITAIKNLILTTGRHTGTFYIETSHATNAGHKTKLILLESHSITLFLISMGHRALIYALETGFGFSKKHIDKIKALPSRWVTIFRTAPVLVMHEGGMFKMD
jgi:kynurenine formamidase